jgi:hypothetical protein
MPKEDTPEKKEKTRVQNVAKGTGAGTPSEEARQLAKQKAQQKRGQVAARVAEAKKKQERQAEAAAPTAPTKSELIDQLPWHLIPGAKEALLDLTLVKAQFGACKRLSYAVQGMETRVVNKQWDELQAKSQPGLDLCQRCA